MNDQALEQFYETTILPRYADAMSIDLSHITWKDHGKVDLDAWAHFFEDKDGREYALVWEDFPGSVFLDDGLTHEIVTIEGDTSLHFQNVEGRSVPSRYGYFTLFREKMLR